MLSQLVLSDSSAQTVTSSSGNEAGITSCTSVLNKGEFLWFLHFRASKSGWMDLPPVETTFLLLGSSESHEPRQAPASHQINEDRGTGHLSIRCSSYSLKVGQGGFGKPSGLRLRLWSVKIFVSQKCLYSFPEGEVLICILSFPQHVPVLENSHSSSECSSGAAVSHPRATALALPS